MAGTRGSELSMRADAGEPSGLSFRGPLAEAWGPSAGAAELGALLRGARDRMSVRPVEDSALWSSVPATLAASLAEEAQKEKRTPWPQPLVSHYARYFRDGNRTAYEDLVRARHQRLTRAVVMASLAAGRESKLQYDPEDPADGTADSDAPDEWLDEVIDGAFLLCEQSSWCWAAHDDVHTRLGHVVPDRDRPYLDLGAGEVAAQLAWLDHVLAKPLDRRAPGLRRRIRREVQERIIGPFLDQNDWHWLGLDGHVHNWNPWIHSNILAAALFLVEDSALQAKTVARCIQGLDRFLAVIPPDGAIDEGFSYWWNGAGRALEALALLEEATAGALTGDLPVVRALVAFPHRMHVGQRWFLNVADGPALADNSLPWNIVRKWALRLGDEESARHAEAMTAPAPDAASGLGRTLHALLEAGSEATPATPPLKAFTYLPSVQIMVARETPGTTEGLLVTAKGGHNGENHNHKDVGSVTVAVDGIPLLVDAGQPTYTAQTFGPHRYGIRAMQSGWHSVPAPFGLEQGAGADFGADVKHAPTPEDPRLVLELARAYGLDDDSQWTRTVSLDRPGSRVLIQDNWALPIAPATAGSDPSTSLASGAEGTNGLDDVDIHLLVAGTVSLGPQGTATVLPHGIPAADAAGATGGGILRGGILRWDQPAAVVLVDEWLLDDPLLAEVWGARLIRLRFRMPIDQRATGSFTLTMEATR